MSRYSDLRTLQQELENPAPLSPKTREWLADGVAAYVAAGEKIALCVCLRLRGRGIRHTNTEMARTERDIALREAFWLMERDDDESPRAAVKRFATLVARFETTTWKRYRHLDDPPNHLSDMQQALLRACRHGMNCRGVPTSDRHLRGIVT